ncbi:MAG: GPW/gp25 family protein [Silvanigrellaceae bacterium]|nr:GPW/gp25 family protein [Silvanigrellaceae bacterium]
MGDNVSLPSRLLILNNLKKDSRDVVKLNMISILNTQSSLGIDKYLEIAERDGLDTRYFGMPSLHEISFESEIDKAKLCKAVKFAIDSFEPRLNDVKINFVNYDKNLKTVKLNVEGFYKASDDDMNIQVILRLTLWEYIIYE